MSIEKSIGWTDITRNPIKGMCKGGCWYCWTRPFYKRKFLSPEICLDLSMFQKIPKKPKKIFLCSTNDLFGPWIPREWRDKIFLIIEQCSQHTFQILTKLPQNIDRPMPDNVWLGISIGDRLGASIDRAKHFTKYIKENEGTYFLSLEPFICTDLSTVSFEQVFPYFEWIAVGRLTGHGKKFDPPREAIEWVVDHCEQLQIPIFLKNNLKEIWGDNLIQEFPGEK